MEFCVQRGFGELHQQASGKENCRVRFGVSATMWCLIIFESNHKWIPVAVVIVTIRKMFFDWACGIHNHIASIENDMIDNKNILPNNINMLYFLN